MYPVGFVSLKKSTTSRLNFSQCSFSFFVSQENINASFLSQKYSCLDNRLYCLRIDNIHSSLSQLPSQVTGPLPGNL